MVQEEEDHSGLGEFSETADGRRPEAAFQVIVLVSTILESWFGRIAAGGNVILFCETHA